MTLLSVTEINEAMFCAEYDSLPWEICLSNFAFVTGTELSGFLLILLKETRIPYFFGDFLSIWIS